jgi:hypothetical protein
VEFLAQMVEANRAIGFAWAEALFMLFLGEGSWLAGAYDQARQTLESLLELAGRCGM